MSAKIAPLSRKARAEIAADSAARAARALVDEEVSQRHEKTARLREARLARDADDRARPDAQRHASRPPDEGGAADLDPQRKEVPTE